MIGKLAKNVFLFITLLQLDVSHKELSPSIRLSNFLSASNTSFLSTIGLTPGFANTKVSSFLASGLLASFSDLFES
jgi:hypothetical protein